MGELLVEGRRMVWRVGGSGPVLLAPGCDDSWTSSMVELMSGEFTLVTATPTDFGRSHRVGGPYSVGRWALEMAARQLADTASP